jgi:hypothetical protein
MFDAPIDAWYVWLGLSVASLAVFGVATSLPTAPVPDAAGVAETIDRVATTEYDTTAGRDLDATAVRIGPRRIGLRNDAGAAHATLSYPVVPVRSSTRLARVLHGHPPAAAFRSHAAFERAVESARNRSVRWRPAGDALHVRHLVSTDIDVTLVGTGPASTRRGVGVNRTVDTNRTAPTNPTEDTAAREGGAGQ